MNFYPLKNNPLKTKEDLAQSLKTIFEPLEKKLVLNGAGLYIGNSGVCYTGRVTLLEGWSRLLWGLAPYLKGGYKWEGFEKHRNGFKEGVDPKSENFWGHVPGCDQRMVEMAAMALSLLLCPHEYWDILNGEEKNNLYSWMDEINHNPMPNNNWQWFRILVNLSFKKLGLTYNIKNLKSDLNRIDELYVDNGWYRDIVPFDNYNPFAFHFYSLVYYHFCKDEDKERCKRFKERSSIFAKQFITIFDKDGSFVPFGRSLTYRFGVVSFFSALAFAGIEAFDWGIMKGIVLRNLRWWFKQPIFDSTGALTVGYTYPSNIFAEEYNSPGSPYWALKTYLLLALDKDHPFWKSEEKDLPKIDSLTLLKEPHIIVQRTNDDVIFINNGQTPAFKMNQVAQKYCKFAYSSKFGFSASLNESYYEKNGCDSMLFLSKGDNYWRGRRECTILLDSTDLLINQWNCFDAKITTFLIPTKYSQIRIHKIESDRDYIIREGGFAVARFKGFDNLAPKELIKKEKGSIELTLPWAYTKATDLLKEKEGKIIYPIPSVNLIASSTSVATLESKIEKGISYHCSLFTSSLKKPKTEEIIDFNLNEKYITINNKTIELPYL